MNIHPVPSKVYSAAFDIRQETFNLEEFNFIPSIRHRNRIASYSKNLSETCGFDRFAILFHHNNRKIWLSNTAFDLAVPYHVHQLFHLDISHSDGSHLQSDHFFPEIDLVNPIYKLYIRLSHEIYRFFTLYTLVRKHSECSMMIYAGSSKNMGSDQDIKALYERSCKAFQEFIIFFLDHNIQIIESFYTPFKYARIYYDPAFRRDLILGKCHETIRALTHKESLCLHWASYGKTAEEIGAILSISPYTVRQHLKEIIAKLSAKNIVNAVYKAKAFGLM